MKVFLTHLLIILAFIFFVRTKIVYAKNQHSISKPSKISAAVAIDDFNRGTAGDNLLKCETGCFHTPHQKAGNNLKQSYSSISSDDWVLRLDYNLTDSTGFVGYFSKLCKTDFSAFANTGILCFYIRGDKKNGFPLQLKLDFKSNDGRYKDSRMVGGITDEWQLVKIPLNRFSNISSWKEMTELVFTFSIDDFSPDDPLVGTVYLDNLGIEQ